MQPLITIHPWTLESLGHDLQGIGGTLYTALASSNWPSANLAIFVPFSLSEEILVTHLWTANGAAASGNLDVGIYTLGGRRLCSAGSTAMSGTSTIQLFDITDYLLGPGEFYLGMSCSNTTAQFLRGVTGSANRGKLLGLAEQASALALPAAATLATYTQNYVPLFGLAMRAI